MEGALAKCYTDLAQAQLLPDAAPYMGLLAKLQQAVQSVIGQIRQQGQQQAQQAAQQLAQGGAPGGAPGQQGLGPPPGPAQFGPGGASGGGSPGLVNMPNPDELRRVLAGSSGGLR